MKIDNSKSLFEVVDMVKLNLANRQCAYEHVNFRGVDLTISVDSNVDDIVMIYLLKKNCHCDRGSK